MSRYFFDIHDGREAVDADGHEFATAWAAIRYAITIASDFVREPRMLPDEGGVVVVTVRDETDLTQATVRLVLSVEAGRSHFAEAAVGS